MDTAPYIFRVSQLVAFISRATSIERDSRDLERDLERLQTEHTIYSFHDSSYLRCSMLKGLWYIYFGKLGTTRMRMRYTQHSTDNISRHVFKHIISMAFEFILSCSTILKCWQLNIRPNRVWRPHTHTLYSTQSATLPT